MLLTIDVGNTCIGCAVFKNDKIIFRNKKLTPGKISQNFLRDFISQKFSNKVDTIIISSVVPNLDNPLADNIKALFKNRPLFVDHRIDTGIKIKIDNPEELGADRIADSAGALFFKQPPVIVVDSGTATTFDVVNKNLEYIGGTISPGIGLAIKSMAENTAKLNDIDFEIPDSIIGTTTANSIRAGIYYSYIGSLNYMITEFKKIVGQEATVFATGGLTKYFENKIKNIDIYEPDLIFYGLKIISERQKAK